MSVTVSFNGAVWNAKPRVYGEADHIEIDQTDTLRVWAADKIVALHHRGTWIDAVVETKGAPEDCSLVVWLTAENSWLNYVAVEMLREVSGLSSATAGVFPGPYGDFNWAQAILEILGRTDA